MTINVQKVREAWKAVVAFAAAVAVVAVDVLDALSQTGGEVTTGNVLVWVTAFAGALGVYAKSNAEKPVEYDEIEDLDGDDEEDVPHTTVANDGNE